MADTYGYGIVVYEVVNGKAHLYRAEHPTFRPDPSATNFYVGDAHIDFHQGGVMGLSLSPVVYENEHPMLYYRPLSSHALYIVNPHELKSGGRNLHVSGGHNLLLGHSQAIGQVFSSDGTLFLGLASEFSIGCWNRYKPLKIVSLM